MSVLIKASSIGVTLRQLIDQVNQATEKTTGPGAADADASRGAWFIHQKKSPS